MRIFEAALILVNLLALVLSMRKQSTTVWLRTASVNLLVFLIHGLFEDFRYQMGFSYVVVILLAVFAFLKANNTFREAKFPRLLRGAGISLSFIFLSITMFLAQAFPVFTLPKPTGDFAVGIQYFHLVDEHRTEPFLDGSTKNRELIVKVYYPAQKDGSKPFSPYFHGSSELIELFATFYHLPEFTFDHVRLVKTNSKEDLRVSDQQESYPVVLFSHGAGTTMEVQTSQSEDLASHGYIVITIDHTYASMGTVFPDRIVSHKEASTDFNTPEPAEIITQIMADDSKFVIDQLSEINNGQIDSVLKGKLDLEKIGVMGHSVGGAVAYNLAINDARVKAAINLDGAVYLHSQDPQAVAPFLMLASDTYHVQAIESREPLMKKFDEMEDIDQKLTIDIYGSQETYEEAYHRAEQNVTGLTEVLRTSGNLFTIEGSDHMKFTDIGLFIGVRPLRELIGIRGETDPARCLEITKAVALAFFDQHLKGKTGASLESLVEKYPELKKIDLK